MPFKLLPINKLCNNYKILYTSNFLQCQLYLYMYVPQYEDNLSPFDLKSLSCASTQTKSNKKYVNKELQFLFELETHPRAYTDKILLGCQAWVFLQQFEHGVVVWRGRRDHPFTIWLIHLHKQNKTGITTSNTIGYVIWQPLLRLLSWCNFISVKSPHLIWASGTRRWNLRVPDLQVSCSDLT